MTALLMMLTTLAGGMDITCGCPRNAVILPIGPVLLHSENVIVTVDGRVLSATDEPVAPVWTCTEGVVVTDEYTSEDATVGRVYGRLAGPWTAPYTGPPPPVDAPGVERAYVPSPSAQYPFSDAGIAFRRSDGQDYLVVHGADGTTRWVDALPPLVGPNTALCLLVAFENREMPGAVGLTADQRLYAANRDGTVMAWAGAGSAREGPKGWCVRGAPDGAWAELKADCPPEVLTIDGGAIIGLGDAPNGLFAPVAVNVGTRGNMCKGHGWLTRVPNLVGRASVRSSGLWYEWQGLALQPGSGEVRVCWDDPELWAPSPDGKWAATIDVYRSAHPADWQSGKSPPEPQEAWLTVCQAGVEWEAPAMRPFVRWGERVYAGLMEYGVPARFRPVWSHDGRLIASGQKVFDALSGAVRAELPGEAPWPLAFRTDGRLVWTDAAADSRALYAWTPGRGQSEELPLPKSARE